MRTRNGSKRAAIPNPRPDSSTPVEEVTAQAHRALTLRGRRPSGDARADPLKLPGDKTRLGSCLRS